MHNIMSNRQVAHKGQ